MVKQIEGRDLSTIPVPELVLGVTRVSQTLNKAGLLPMGLDFLLIGSLKYRPIDLFFDTHANKGLTFERPECIQLYREWIKESHYDGFSSENLIATALYQYEERGQNIENFPKPGTEEYLKLVQRMGFLGRYVRQIKEVKGENEMHQILFEISRGIF
jgi:hypothetical protein